MYNPQCYPSMDNPPVGLFTEYNTFAAAPASAAANAIAVALGE